MNRMAASCRAARTGSRLAAKTGRGGDSVRRTSEKHDGHLRLFPTEQPLAHTGAHKSVAKLGAVRLVDPRPISPAAGPGFAPDRALLACR